MLPRRASYISTPVCSLPRVTAWVINNRQAHRRLRLKSDLGKVRIFDRCLLPCQKPAHVRHWITCQIASVIKNRGVHIPSATVLGRKLGLYTVAWRPLQVCGFTESINDWPSRFNKGQNAPKRSAIGQGERHDDHRIAAFGDFLSRLGDLEHVNAVANDRAQLGTG